MANEKRLIDAGRHERILQGFAGHLLEAGKTEAAEAVNTLIKGLKLEPTVDAVEVVHGSWWETKHMIPTVACSVCEGMVRAEYTHEYVNRKKYNFCPYCGAKMDGGNEDGC